VSDNNRNLSIGATYARKRDREDAALVARRCDASRLYTQCGMLSIRFTAVTLAARRVQDP